jgi:hypothetical protein
MIFRVGIENNNDGRSIAWALEHPGCFAYGANASAACVNLETALQRYATWILKNEPNTWLNFDAVEIIPEETWEVYSINEKLDKVEAGGYYVESFFRYDWKPLSQDEVGQVFKMLSWTRDELVKAITGLSAEKKDAKYAGERWSINGILGHIGDAEWWYLDRLGLAFPEKELVKEPVACLKQTRDMFRRSLPGMAGVSQVVGRDGEFWSPRKVVRRALWHELDHIEHIKKLI